MLISSIRDAKPGYCDVSHLAGSHSRNFPFWEIRRPTLRFGTFALTGRVQPWVTAAELLLQSAEACSRRFCPRPH